MDIIKVRRVGHSNVISLPRQFEAASFTPGTAVVVEQTEGGALLITPIEVVRAQRRALVHPAIATNQAALDLLAAYDRGEEVARRRAPEATRAP